MWCEAKAKLKDIISNCGCLPDYVDEFGAFNISNARYYSDQNNRVFRWDEQH
jgi:hypothetical protein